MYSSGLFSHGPAFEEIHALMLILFCMYVCFSLLCATDSLPTSFTSPVTSEQVSRSKSHKDQTDKPLPNPKPVFPSNQTVPGTKPAIPKKPDFANGGRKGPPLAAFQSPEVKKTDVADKPKVRTAFVRQASDPSDPDITGDSQRKPRSATVATDVPDRPSLNQVPPSPLSPVTASQASPSVSRCLYQDTGASKGSPRLLQRQFADAGPEVGELSQSPLETRPDSPGGSDSPGQLQRRRAIRAKKGEQISSIRPLSVSPIGGMQKAQRSPGPHRIFSASSSEQVSLTVDSPSFNSSLQSSAGSSKTFDGRYSPSAGKFLEQPGTPVISQRFASLAPGSASNSRANSPERQPLVRPSSAENTGEKKLPSASPKPLPEIAIQPLPLDVPQSKEQTSYVPSPTSPTSQCYIPSRSSSGRAFRDSQASAALAEDKVEKDLETVKRRAASLARRTDPGAYSAIGSPIVASSRKAFNEAFMKFSDVSRSQERLPKSTSTTSFPEPEAQKSTLGHRRVSHDTLPANFECKVKQLAEMYGGVGGIKKAPVPIPDKGLNAAEPQQRHTLAAGAKPPCVEPVSTAPQQSLSPVPGAKPPCVEPASTAPQQPLSPVPTDTPAAPEQAPPPKKGSSIPRRISFKNFKEKVSPVINRKGNKKKNPKDRSKSDAGFNDGLQSPPQESGRRASADSSMQTSILEANTSPVHTHTSSATDQNSLSVPAGKSGRSLSLPDKSQCTPNDQALRQPLDSSHSPASPPPIGSPGARLSRQARYGTVKTLVSNSAAPQAMSPPRETSFFPDGSSTTPVHCTPSPDLFHASQESAISGSSSSSVTLSPTAAPISGQTMNGAVPSFRGGSERDSHGDLIDLHSQPVSSESDQIYDEVEFVESGEKATLAASDSGYSTNQESLINTIAAGLTPAVTVSHVYAAQSGVTSNLIADDKLYDDVPMEEGNTDDDLDNESTDRLESPYEDVIVPAGGESVTSLPHMLWPDTALLFLIFLIYPLQRLFVFDLA